MLLIGAVLSGCATHNHGRAYLMRATSGDKIAPSIDGSEEPFRDQFKTEIYNAISIPPDTDFQVKIDELHLGFLHDNLSRMQAGKGDRRHHEGLGGKEVWVLVTAHSLDPNDPLGLNEKRFAKAFSVKVDQESFSFMPHDDLESIVFDGRSSQSYRLTFRVYEVDGFQLRKILAQTAGKGIVRELYDAASGVVASTTNVLFKEFVDSAKQRLEEPLTFERLMLTLGASIEFMATVDINRDGHMEKWPDRPVRYALWDKNKDGDIARVGLSEAAYFEKYIERHAESPKLPTKEELRAVDLNSLKPNEKNLLKFSYCKFNIEPATDEVRARNATLGKVGFDRVLFELKEEQKNEAAKRKFETAKSVVDALASSAAAQKSAPRGKLEDFIRGKFDNSDSTVIKIIAKLKQLAATPDTEVKIDDLLTEARKALREQAAVAFKQQFAYETDLLTQVSKIQREITTFVANELSTNAELQNIHDLLPSDVQARFQIAAVPLENGSAPIEVNDVNELSIKLLGMKPVTPEQAVSLAPKRHLEAQKSVEVAAPTVQQEILALPDAETALSKQTDQVLPQATDDETRNVAAASMIDLDDGAIGFRADMAVDVDGAPNAYNLENTGLDYIANAGLPYLDSGKKLSTGDPDWQTTWKIYYERAKAENFLGPTRFDWFGIVTDANNVPVLQKDTDPFPGYFVSATALTNQGVQDLKDPRRYIDATKIPYIVLPREAIGGLYNLKLGDLAAVYRPSKQTVAFAIVADIGPRGKYGEGSPKLIEDLGKDPYHNGRAKRGLPEGDAVYIIFSGTGNGYGKTIDEIKAQGEAAFDKWGGLPKLKAKFGL